MILYNLLLHLSIHHFLFAHPFAPLHPKDPHMRQMELYTNYYIYKYNEALFFFI